MCAYMCICVYISMHIHMSVCIFVSVFVCVGVYTYMSSSEIDSKVKKSFLLCCSKLKPLEVALSKGRPYTTGM